MGEKKGATTKIKTKQEIPSRTIVQEMKDVAIDTSKTPVKKGSNRILLELRYSNA